MQVTLIELAIAILDARITRLLLPTLSFKFRSQLLEEGAVLMLLGPT